MSIKGLENTGDMVWAHISRMLKIGRLYAPEMKLLFRRADGSIRVYDQWVQPDDEPVILDFTEYFIVKTYPEIGIRPDSDGDDFLV